MGTVENISLGPGTLYVAQVGSTEPADLATAWDAAWKEIGYTAEGTEVTMDIARDPVDVAESIDPVMYATTSRTTTVAFAMAELTARNLQIALNGGTITTGTGIVTFDPPEAGQETSLALGWESDNGQERWIWRKTSQSGSIAIGRRKGSDKATIPVTMNVEAVTGEKPFTVIMDETRAGGAL